MSIVDNNDTLKKLSEKIKINHSKQVSEINKSIKSDCVTIKKELEKVIEDIINRPSESANLYCGNFFQIKSNLENFNKDNLLKNCGFHPFEYEKKISKLTNLNINLYLLKDSFNNLSWNLYVYDVIYKKN